jgi:hypothetical protein
MPVACTRCGAKQEGEILNVTVAFRFPHEPGCGQGVGPLAIIKGKVSKPKETPKEVPKEKSAKEIIVEELKPQVVEAKKTKTKVFGQKD